MKEEEVDKIFSENLKDREVIPPSFIWQEIESTLDEKKVVPLKSKGKWQVWTIAACLLIALGISLKLYVFQHKPVLETAMPTVDQEISQSDRSISRNVPILEVDSPGLSKPEQDNLAGPSLEKQKKNLIARTVEIKRNKKPVIADVNISREITENKSADKFPKIVPTREMEIVNQVELEEIKADKTGLSAVEAAPIQPLVNVIEQEELMYAESRKEPKKKQTIFTHILNTLSENINPTNKSVKFSSDDEGSIKVDLINSIAKTRR